MRTPLIALLVLLALPSCLTIEVHLPEDLGQTRAAAERDTGLQTITIDEALLASSEGSPARVFENQANYRGTVLLRMGRHEDFEQVKAFMSDADQTFKLQFDGGEPIPGRVGIGGMTSNGVSYAIWRPSGRDLVPESAMEINVRAVNEDGERRWSVAPHLALR